MSRVFLFHRVDVFGAGSPARTDGRPAEALPGYRYEGVGRDEASGKGSSPPFYRPGR
ncbi:MAG: hypothetical protein R2751_00720 [Bacteroidales bacterium]